MSGSLGNRCSRVGSINFDLVLYYSCVGAVSALAGVFRCVHNGDFQSVSHCISVAGVSGFLGFGVVALVAGDPGQPDFNFVFYLGIASIIGLAGREQRELISIIWKGTISRLLNHEPPKT